MIPPEATCSAVTTVNLALIDAPVELSDSLSGCLDFAWTQFYPPRPTHGEVGTPTSSLNI